MGGFQNLGHGDRQPRHLRRWCPGNLPVLYGRPDTAVARRHRPGALDGFGRVPDLGACVEVIAVFLLRILDNQKRGVGHSLQNYVLLTLDSVFADDTLEIYELEKQGTFEDKTRDFVSPRDRRRDR